MYTIQHEITLLFLSRGFHLITQKIIHAMPEIQKFAMGTMHVFIKHSSASISINENTDPAVRVDFENYFSRLIPDDSHYFTHSSEGSDDMPAHIKASLLGSSVTIPITKGRLNMGIWQGIYLGEHRNYGTSRTLVVTIIGVRASSIKPKEAS